MDIYAAVSYIHPDPPHDTKSWLKGISTRELELRHCWHGNVKEFDGYVKFIRHTGISFFNGIINQQRSKN